MTALAADFPNALPDLRWPAGARNALALCAVGSLALHLAFAIVARPAADGAPRQAAKAVGSSNTVQLRLIAPSPAPAPPVAAPTASDPALAPLQKAEAPTRPVAKATPLSHPAIEAPRAATEASAPTVDRTAPPADTSTPPPIIDPANPTGFDDYIPRPLLSVGPAATVPVLIDTPIGNFGVARQMGILSLFIDEEGAVQHVAGSEPLLPALLEQAAREAFMAARFTPGEVDGRPVKSRIRVEVVFDNTPLK
jgi:hypothetical protein